MLFENLSILWLLAAWLLGMMFGWAVGSYIESRSAYRKFLEVLAEVERRSKGVE